MMPLGAKPMKTLALRAAMLSLAATTAFAVPISPADARPTYCVQQAWYYADRKAGPDRQSEQWSYYNALFQDYNDCYGPNACNDVTEPCRDPE